MKRQLNVNFQRKKVFSKLEDHVLSELVKQFGLRKWKIIAQHMPGRTAKECKERYFNYLSPNFANTKWSHEEDKFLIEKYNELGPKWGILSRHFKGKNSNDLSNRWKYLNSHKCKSKKDKINSENKRSTVTKKEDIIRKNENAHNNSLPKKADTSRFPSISLLIKDLPIFNVKQRE